VTVRAAISRRVIFASLALAGALALASTDAPAQGGPANALQGFSKNRNEPVKIQAASLEVRDKDKVATFSGDVHVVQGDTDMRCKVLVVFYEEEPGKPSLPAAQPGPGGSQQIRRMEARGGVVVTQKEQTATGELGEFEMRANTVTLTGNVVVTKGETVMRGQKLVVNLTTGVSRMDGGRVEGLFVQPPRSEGQGPGQPGQPQRKN
jgi:lipopolysaccharide export system protein LptA